MKPFYAIVIGTMLLMHVPFQSCCKNALDDPIAIIDIIQTEEICNLNNGTITINVASPLPTMLYSIDNGANFQSSNFFDGLESGDYLIIVVDGISCSESFSVQLTDAPEPEVDIDIICVEGLNKANIYITPFPTGIFPFTYNWIGPNNTSYNTRTLTEVDPGTYAVTVTDRLGCVIDTTFTIEQCCALDLFCTVDTVYLDCLSELEDLPAVFSDQTSENNQDSIALSSININVNASCSEIIARGTVMEASPMNCDLGPREVKWMFDISDGVSTIQCEKVYLIDNFLGIETLQAAQNLMIDCADNVDSLYQDWIDNHGFMEFNSCSGQYNLSTDPINLSILYDCPGEGNSSVSFIIEDECSNQLLNIASFELSDSSSPEITCPPNQTFDMDDADLETQLNLWVDLATATDNCSNVALNSDFDFSSINISCDAQNITVNFFASDECDNLSECNADINLINSFSPTLDCPPSLVLECVDASHQQEIDQWIQSVESYNFDNTLLPTTYNSDFQDINLVNCGDIFTFEFYIDDACAQGINCLTELRFEDEEVPQLTCPENLELSESSLDFELQVNNWLDLFIATDNCLVVERSLDIDLNELDEPCNMSEMTIITQFALDACNNNATCQSSLIVLPSLININCPEQLTIECGDENNQFLIDQWLTEADAIDEFLSAVPVTNDFDFNMLAQDCGYTQLVVFNASNNCNRIGECQSEITIIDSQAPEIICPASQNINIDTTTSTVVEQWLNSVDASDICSTVNLSNDFSLDLSDIVCSEISLINFYAEDECGNISECQSQLEFINTSSITIYCPESIEVVCNGINTQNEIFYFLDSYEITSDQDFEVFNNFDIDMIDSSCEEQYGIDIEFTALDICNNSTDCETSILVFPEPKVYIPNIFSPSGFDQNSRFTVFSNASVDEVTSFMVFNRWGSKIYENSNFQPNDLSEGWDGTFQGKVENGQVYTYYAVVRSIFGESLEFSGSIQVID